MVNFKTILANRRKELKLTQRDLAQKINVSDKTISKWETGASYPDLTIINSLAKALDMNVNDLLGADDIQGEIHDNEEYDLNIIKRFKNNIIIIIGLQILSIIIFMLSSIAKSNELVILIYVLASSVVIISFILLFVNIISYRSFYINKFHLRQYDNVFYNYLTFYLYFITSLILLPPLILTSYRPSSIIILLISFLILLIIRKSHFKLIKDKLNTILIFFISTFFILASIINLYLLLGYNNIPIYSYTASLLMAIAFILYIIFTRRVKYIKV